MVCQYRGLSGLRNLEAGPLPSPTGWAEGGRPFGPEKLAVHKWATGLRICPLGLKIREGPRGRYPSAQAIGLGNGVPEPIRGLNGRDNRSY